MSGFTITITDAGRAALINAQNTGTNAFVLSQIGVSTQHITTGLVDLATLPNERKRLGTMAGDVVSDDTLHVTIRDEGNDAYPMRAFGLYTSTGILFAVYSQPDPVIEKSAAAMLLLAVDAKLVALSTNQVEFGPVGFTLPPASETVAGITEVATDAEADAGTDNWRYITPRLLKRALAALSGFALLGHTHDAADTTSGVFNVGRIPSLSMEKITGLANALAGKASEIHTHTLAQITGLVETLAQKAALVHQHHADDIAQGVLAVGRIPALAMEKITGLAIALAGKASLDAAVRFANVTFGLGNAMVYSNGDDVFVRAGPSAASKFFGFDSNGNFSAHSGLVYTRNGRVWDPQNFNPADKANALHSHDWSQITGKGDVVLTSATGLGRLNSGTLTTFGNLAEIVAKPTGFTTMVTNGSAGMPPYLGYFIKLATRDAGQGWTGLFATFVGTGEQSDLYVGGTDQGHHQPVWTRVLTDANLKFANVGEMLNGAINYRMISPEGLWSFAKSIGPSGFVQIPGTDLIVQWGSNNASIAEGETHAYLPTAFGGGCLVAMAIPRNPGANIGMDFYMQIAGRYLDRIVFYANRANNSSGSMSGYEWIAIGLAKGNPNPPYSSGGGGGGGWVPPDIEQP